MLPHLYTTLAPCACPCAPHPTTLQEGESQDAYARAGEAAIEALSLIRTVTAFGGARAEVARYDTHLKAAERQGQFKAFGTGFSECALCSQI